MFTFNGPIVTIAGVRQGNGRGVLGKASPLCPRRAVITRQPPVPSKVTDHRSAVAVEAPAGSLIVFHGNTWHGALPRRRPGYRFTLISYVVRLYLVRQEQPGYVTDEMRERTPSPVPPASRGPHTLPVQRGDPGPDVPCQRGRKEPAHMTAVALVTGAPRGIGRAVALEATRRDYDVLVRCGRDKRRAEEVVAAIEKLGRRALDKAVADGLVSPPTQRTRTRPTRRTHSSGPVSDLVAERRR
jgi:hypothetical protein